MQLGGTASVSSMTEDAMFFESNRILPSFCCDSPRRFVGCHMRAEDVARVEMSAKCAGITRKDGRACSMQNQNHAPLLHELNVIASL